mmetsp:Transcript_4962/g.14858  ORF Transcript_4962/g.14858 Transcript_4962/m.14858 type:complete len:257 (+) Transcript_4962:1892-2662(+)
MNLNFSPPRLSLSLSQAESLQPLEDLVVLLQDLNVRNVPGALLDEAPPLPVLLHDGEGGEEEGGQPPHLDLDRPHRRGHLTSLALITAGETQGEGRHLACKLDGAIDVGHGGENLQENSVAAQAGEALQHPKHRRPRLLVLFVVVLLSLLRRRGQLIHAVPYGGGEVLEHCACHVLPARLVGVEEGELAEGEDALLDEDSASLSLHHREGVDGDGPQKFEEALATVRASKGLAGLLGVEDAPEVIHNALRALDACG